MNPQRKPRRLAVDGSRTGENFDQSKQLCQRFHLPYDIPTRICLRRMGGALRAALHCKIEGVDFWAAQPGGRSEAEGEIEESASPASRDVEVKAAESG
jgi:hypothetical protein